MISRQQLNKSPKSKRKSSKMEREIKYGQTLKEDEDGKMIPYYYIIENDDDPPPQYKSPLSSPRHKNKKELIKSSKNLGNKIQNDNLITDEDLEYFVDNTKKLEDFTKKFKDYKSPLSSPRHKNKKELIKSSKNLGNKIQNDNLITDEDLEYFVDNTKKLEDFTKKFKDYKSPLSSPRHKNKKELIKSSKNLGNKIQNDNNISHLDIGISQIEQEIFEFNSNDFKNIQIYKPFIHKIKCLNTRINTYIKLTLDFEIYNVYDFNGKEYINQLFFTDEIIIRIVEKTCFEYNYYHKGIIDIKPHYLDENKNNIANFVNSYYSFIFCKNTYNTYYGNEKYLLRPSPNGIYNSYITAAAHNTSIFDLYMTFDTMNKQNQTHNLINIDDDLLYFNLQICDTEHFLNHFLVTQVENKYYNSKEYLYNFEKSKIICKILKEIK